MWKIIIQPPLSVLPGYITSSSHAGKKIDNKKRIRPRLIPLYFTAPPVSSFIEPRKWLVKLCYPFIFCDGAFLHLNLSSPRFSFLSALITPSVTIKWNERRPKWSCDIQSSTRLLFLRNLKNKWDEKKNAVHIDLYYKAKLAECDE